MTRTCSRLMLILTINFLSDFGELLIYLAYIRLGYANGIDFGISPLGDAVEPYGPLQETYGALHAMGRKL